MGVSLLSIHINNTIIIENINIWICKEISEKGWRSCPNCPYLFFGWDQRLIEQNEGIWLCLKWYNTTEYVKSIILQDKKQIKNLNWRDNQLYKRIICIETNKIR